jgi:hypothetical protein
MAFLPATQSEEGGLAMAAFFAVQRLYGWRIWTLNDGLLEINSVGIFSTFFRRQSLGYNADSALFPSFKRFCSPGAHRSPDSLARASVANAGLFQFTLSWSMDLETDGWGLGNDKGVCLHLVDKRMEERSRSFA